MEFARLMLLLGALEAESWVCVDMIDGVSGAYQRKRFVHLSDVDVIKIEDSANVLESKLSGHYVFDGDATKITKLVL
ncbi:MAG: hypothetical protein MZV65_32655 [Chromatiales bacterium]|nr:hypothetical protein [Chromatiales bacterium]